MAIGENIPTTSVHSTFDSATQADRQVRQVKAQMAKIWPDMTPFTAYTGKRARKRELRQNKDEWMRLGIQPLTVVLAADLTAVATSVVTTGCAHVTADMLLFNPDPASNEVFLVRSVSGATITVAARGYGGTAAALSAGAVLLVGPVSREEGLEALAATGITPSFDYNYGQQLETVNGITDRAKGVAVYGKGQMDLDDMNSIHAYNMQVETMSLFGRRKYDAPGSAAVTAKGRWNAGGMLDYAEAEGMTASAEGSFTYPEFCEFMRVPSRHSQSKVFKALCGQQVMQIMGFWELDTNTRNLNATDELGINITKIKGPGGWRLELYPSELFEVEGLHNQLYIWDPEYVEAVVSAENPGKTFKNITGGAKDGSHVFKNQITGIETVRFLNPATLLIVRDIDQ